MGTLRLFLALCVLVEHSGQTIFAIQPLAGYLAVQSFYIISGFYMALVLSERYSSTRLFYISRFLRILPMYWIVLGLTVAAALFVPHFLRHLPESDFASRSIVLLSGIQLSLVAIANTLLVGLDWLHFISVDAQGHLIWEHQHYLPDGPFNFGRLQLVPQAWTLGMEITFYLCAPWFARINTKSLVAILGISLAGRFIASRYGLHSDPWTYRFFPFELAFFVTGMLCYRVYRALPKMTIVPSIGIGSIALLIGIGICYSHFLPDTARMMPAKHWAYLTMLAALLPFIFSASKDWKIDGWVGELSYPVYISHYTVGMLLLAVGIFPFDRALIVMIASLAVSVILLWAARPIDQLRQRFRVASVWHAKPLATAGQRTTANRRGSAVASASS